MEIRKPRPGDEAGIALVHVESWETTYRGIMPDEILDNHSQEFREEQWAAAIENKNDIIYVAEDEDSLIVGFVMGGPNRSDYEKFHGELYAIYLLESEQGKGIGRALTQALMREFLEIGFDSMMLGVADGNPAYKFYEALGGVKIGAEDVKFRGHPIHHIYYGWSDIRPILEK